jgi:aspartyl aminopeptidase
MNDFILNGLKTCYTPYHVAETAREYLEKHGFTPLYEQDEWKLKQGGKYVVMRGGTSIIAFTVGELANYRFKIVASHTDSPAIKLKYEAATVVAGVSKLNVETYGGGIWHTFTDVPLALAGRIVVQEGNMVRSVVYTDPNTFVIPNVAIHMNRKANDGFVYNPQVDLSPILGDAGDSKYLEGIANGKKLVGYDLYLVNKTQPFFAGVDGKFLCSGRLDNQLSALSSVEALVNAQGDGICLAFLADSEEVGSRTNEGADSDFLAKTVTRINRALGFTDDKLDGAIAKSFVVSADNAHATHPNHAELSDPTNKVELGGGVVVKHHANKNYTTTGLTCAAFSALMESLNVKVQNFFMRSDLRCGSTLGAISSSHVSVSSVDIGVPQLAMHSSLETVVVSDVEEYLACMKGFYSSKISVEKEGINF